MRSRPVADAPFGVGGSNPSGIRPVTPGGTVSWGRGFDSSDGFTHGTRAGPSVVTPHPVS